MLSYSVCTSLQMPSNMAGPKGDMWLNFAGAGICLSLHGDSGISDLAALSSLSVVYLWCPLLLRVAGITRVWSDVARSFSENQSRRVEVCLSNLNDWLNEWWWLLTPPYRQRWHFDSLKNQSRIGWFSDEQEMLPDHKKLIASQRCLSWPPQLNNVPEDCW